MNNLISIGLWWRFHHSEASFGVASSFVCLARFVLHVRAYGSFRSWHRSSCSLLYFRGLVSRHQSHLNKCQTKLFYRVLTCSTRRNIISKILNSNSCFWVAVTAVAVESATPLIHIMLELFDTAFKCTRLITVSSAIVEAWFMRFVSLNLWSQLAEVVVGCGHKICAVWVASLGKVTLKVALSHVVHGKCWCWRGWNS